MYMQNEQIKQLIEQGIPESFVEIGGDDGTHFDAIVVSERFSGLNMVKQHQLVYQALGEKMGREIHALSIRTFTPDEWEKSKGLRVL